VMLRWSNKINFYIINRHFCVIEWISLKVSLPERPVSIAECWSHSQHQLPFSGASFATSVQGKFKLKITACCCYICLVNLGEMCWELWECFGYRSART
jgi:hypothetical protein